MVMLKTVEANLVLAKGKKIPRVFIFYFIDWKHCDGESFVKKVSISHESLHQMTLD